MKQIQVRFLGSGDAFGCGGRLQPCIQIGLGGLRFLLDCGATSLPAIKRYYINPNEIEMIIISHLHGDHFCGIPFFILDAQLISKRSQPLIIAGPPGIEQRCKEAMEVMFSGSSKIQQKFSIEYVELLPGAVRTLYGIEVASYSVQHPSGAPSLALRFNIAGKIIAYTGDTEWTDNLIPACREADVVITEAYFFEKKVKFHMDYRSMMGKKDELGIKRMIITHMSEDMLEKIGEAEVECEYADDGKVFYI